MQSKWAKRIICDFLYSSLQSHDYQAFADSLLWATLSQNSFIHYLYLYCVTQLVWFCRLVDVQNYQDGLNKGIEILKSVPNSYFLNHFVITQYRSICDAEMLISSNIHSFILSILDVTILVILSVLEVCSM